MKTYKISGGVNNMKDKTIAYGLYFGLGFLTILIFITVVLPWIRSIINEADVNRPTIPTAYHFEKDQESNLIIRLEA